MLVHRDFRGSSSTGVNWRIFRTSSGNTGVFGWAQGCSLEFSWLALFLRSVCLPAFANDCTDVDDDGGGGRDEDPGCNEKDGRGDDSDDDHRDAEVADDCDDPRC